MRKFQIRNTDKSGSGSFYYIEVEDDATDEKIFQKAESVMVEVINKYKTYSGSIFGGGRDWKKKLKVVEIRKGKDGYSHTKRGGRKFSLEKELIKINDTVFWGYTAVEN